MPTPFSGLSGFPAGPRTPEPTASSFPPDVIDAQPPSPPRPRLRLKRRAVPHLSAPTQNFLASVAAADVPIPSIEIPDQDDHDLPSIMQPQRQPQQQQRTPGLFPTDSIDSNLLSVCGHSTFSPPKTPAPSAVPSASPSRYPNWRMGSVFSSSTESSPDPECESSSRPSTARSTQTSSSSLFSRFSQLSDDEHCISPEEETSSTSKVSLGDHMNELRRNSASGGTFSNYTDYSNDDSTAAGQKRHARKAAWTNAMSSHLWATYILYLQDPKVTPFRIGKSCIPPHGVLVRVAREAKRSWKGAKALAKMSASSANSTRNSAAASLTVPASVPAATRTSDSSAQPDGSTSKSGSSTPTATESKASGTFMEWPFTNAATRSHLRELCRKKAATPGGGARGLQYMSRSPTPLTQSAATRHRDMRVTPGLSGSSTFATHDMIKSLALSASETMLPHGPLAQLTRSGSGPSTGLNTAPPLSLDGTLASSTGTADFASVALAPATHSPDFSGRLASAIETEEPSFAERRRLGSPFTARSYGPSSSSSLAAVLGLSTSNSRQPHTVGPRRSLQSPVRLSRSGTQKRRTKHLSQDLRRRPGLASDIFTEPSADLAAGLPGIECRHDGFNSSGATHNEKLFIPRTGTVPALTSSSSAPQLATTSSNSQSLDEFASASQPQQQQASPPLVRRPDMAGLLDAAPLQPLARLGSPFSSLPGNNTSFSFPNRFSQPTDLDISTVGRPFATVQRSQTKPVPARTNLASRLAYIDQRLRELNNRNDNQHRQPDSPS
ncbi:uncharacterized protein SPSK_03103 [Sporothrix schenckii 1099-18]|uniref:Uncharacterized protein n=2 Tax=Sporothrix schenckii TaxID=29908 RepID=U7PQT3_SPOS1|nr:uncharacterized protein SPSK_03103 [Sporothrix schenckii 1099-18]ERS97993.1 hypothetical protein HMPREF1624_06166 [Sporothrix schenckii ATCC 58251]KJR82583.1 hypothetical protein SPSK_03103 [Sporothrix schenckii 1099-18]